MKSLALLVSLLASMSVFISWDNIPGETDVLEFQAGPCEPWQDVPGPYPVVGTRRLVDVSALFQTHGEGLFRVRREWRFDNGAPLK